MVAALCLLPGFICGAGNAASPDSVNTALDHGFLGLYNLDFTGAQRDFSVGRPSILTILSARSARPPDVYFRVQPPGRAGERSSIENDESFNGRSKLSPDPAVHEPFQEALDRAQRLARARLSKDSKDRDALFAMTLASGLQADYAALIEKKNLSSLHYTKEASVWAQQLLAVCNDCSDVLVATGFSEYIIGSMTAPVRWLLRMGGLPGDKQGGIARFADDRGTRPLSETLCPHIARDCLRARQG